MKRMILLICAFVLVLDLSDDGRLGKATSVVTPSPVKSLQASPGHDGSAGPVCQAEQTLANLQYAPCQSPGQPLTRVVQHTRKLIISSHLTSAGGLPG